MNVPLVLAVSFMVIQVIDACGHPPGPPKPPTGRPPKPPTGRPPKPPKPPTQGPSSWECHTFDKNGKKGAMAFCGINGGCGLCVTTRQTCTFASGNVEAKINEQDNNTIKKWIKGFKKNPPQCPGGCNICRGPYQSRK